MIAFIVLYIQEQQNIKQINLNMKYSSEEAPVFILDEKFSLEIFRQKVQFNSFQVISEEQTKLFAFSFLAKKPTFFSFALLVKTVCLMI